MSFDSFFFLGIFLPLLMVCYHLSRSTGWKNTVLLAAGLLFYAFGSLSGLILLIVSAVLNYCMGQLIQQDKARKPVLAMAVVGNLLFLGVFKYLNFLLCDILQLPAVQLSLAAPIGISFFTFKAISYLVDTYRAPSSAARRFSDFLLYLSFFPQIACGPIQRFQTFSPQLENRQAGQTAPGMRRFVVGLSKKVLLSVPLGLVVNEIFQLDAPDARLAWLAFVAYLLQIYLDFSGYSDMAIGLAQAFGFVSPENFRYPYTADSITDFWRRWHLSLSSWFKDYVYIPLGGNRKGKFRTGLNKAIVFLLCGLWHGANWTYVLWGLWHGLFAALESSQVLKPKKTLGRLYTLLVAGIGFLMFRAGTVSQGLTIIGSLFAGWQFSAANTVLLAKLLNLRTIFLIAVGILVCMPIRQRLENSKYHTFLQAVSYPVCLILFALSLMQIAACGFIPFIYAQF